MHIYIEVHAYKVINRILFCEICRKITDRLRWILIMIFLGGQIYSVRRRRAMYFADHTGMYADAYDSGEAVHVSL